MFVRLIKEAFRLTPAFLFGSTGETLTEKSGHLNLGTPGIMCMGAAGGMIGITVYDKICGGFANSNNVLTFIFVLFFALLLGALSGFIFSFFTVSLRCNQNVMGLAYTTFGGDTLDIEVTTYPGKGGLLLTGKLGDVMKESAQAAFSYVRHNAKDLGIDEEVFQKCDVHIHVPEGATPKDGPSAGVTLTTALVSALANKPVDCHIGMTGEITLRGAVLPIGGLREKSIAAHRSGLTKIFIPIENERDIEDIPEEVRKDLEIKPVTHVSEILNAVF